jgi:hypothetical protein
MCETLPRPPYDPEVDAVIAIYANAAEPLTPDGTPATPSCTCGGGTHGTTSSHRRRRSRGRPSVRAPAGRRASSGRSSGSAVQRGVLPHTVEEPGGGIAQPALR